MTPLDIETGYYWILTTNIREPMIGFFYKDTNLPPWFFYGDDNCYGWDGMKEVICRIEPPTNWK